MNKHEAKRIARNFTSRKTISDVEALGVLYEMREKKPSLDLKEAIDVLEKKVLGGNSGSDVVVFIEDSDGNIEESYKITPEDSFREPYRSLIDEWGSATLQEYVSDIVDNPDIDWSEEIERISKRSNV